VLNTPKQEIPIKNQTITIQRRQYKMMTEVIENAYQAIFSNKNIDFNNLTPECLSEPITIIQEKCSTAIIETSSLEIEVLTLRKVVDQAVSTQETIESLEKIVKKQKTEIELLKSELEEYYDKENMHV